MFEGTEEKYEHAQIKRKRELADCELETVSGGGQTNGDNPFVKAVLDAYSKTLRGWPPAGRGDCRKNHNGV